MTVMQEKFTIDYRANFDGSVRVWNSKWAHDMFETYSAANWQICKIMLQTLGIDVRELDDDGDEVL